jgi:Ser/Thr protein kinase RdoA (MazF antagonist)
MENMNSNSIPVSITQQWLEPLVISTIRAVPAGMSGARVFCCAGEHGERYALKRWPRSVDRYRVDEVHHVIRASRNSGCQLVPTVMKSPIHSGGYCWDLLQWMPGEPLAVDASLPSIELGAAAIARFHSSTLDLGRRYQVAPAVTERLSRLIAIDQQIDATLDTVPRGNMTPSLSTAVHRARQLLRLNWNEVRPKISRSLSIHAQRNVATQFVLRDVHREHILFADDQPRGLIDFDAIRIDTPAVDLARWAGSCWVDRTTNNQRKMETIWNSVMAGVRSECPSREGDFEESDLEMARAIAFANPWISLANWLIWLLTENREFPSGPQTVAQRISTLSDSAAAANWVE